MHTPGSSILAVVATKPSNAYTRLYSGFKCKSGIVHLQKLKINTAKDAGLYVDPYRFDARNELTLGMYAQ